MALGSDDRNRVRRGSSAAYFTPAIASGCSIFCFCFSYVKESLGLEKMGGYFRAGGNSEYSADNQRDG